MKKLIFFSLGIFLIGSASSCKSKGPSCPAYNSVHNTKDYGYNPNNAARKKEDNKKDVEKRKEAELDGKPPKRSNAYSLFPKGVGGRK
jgi:hypothetical protein